MAKKETAYNLNHGTYQENIRSGENGDADQRLQRSNKPWYCNIFLLLKVMIRTNTVKLRMSPKHRTGNSCLKETHKYYCYTSTQRYILADINHSYVRKLDFIVREKQTKQTTCLQTTDYAETTDNNTDKQKHNHRLGTTQYKLQCGERIEQP